MARPKRDDIAVKIDARIYRKAKIIAAHRGITMAEFLSSLLEKPVQREYEKMLPELEGGKYPGDTDE